MHRRRQEEALMHFRRRQPDESGFTLIELLISTVILGFIGSAVAACIILFFRTADGTSRRFALSRDSEMLATYLTPDLDSLAGNKPGSPRIVWVAPPPPGCPSGSASFSDLKINFSDAQSGNNYQAHYKVTGSAITRSFTDDTTDFAVVHNLKHPYLACFSTRASAPWTMTVTTGLPDQADTSDDYTFSVTAGGRVANPPPSAPMLAATSDSGTKGDNITNDTTPTFIGTAVPGDTITLFKESAQVGTGIADGGNYSITVTSALADGPHTFTATAKDPTDGSVSAPSEQTKVTIDTTKPQTPSEPVLAAGGNFTNLNTPSFTGTASGNPSIILFEGSTPVGAGTSNGVTYTATIGPPYPPLADGPHTIVAETVDAAGNVSLPSPYDSITIDTAATMPTIHPIANGSTAATGTLGTLPGGSATTNFAIYPGTAITGAIAAPVNVVTNGDPWNVTWTGLPPGMPYTLVVTQTDPAGDVAAAEQTFTQ
jgi:prepilin-type N-terminal cleavage/methylation domain-containing protein